MITASLEQKDFDDAIMPGASATIAQARMETTITEIVPCAIEQIRYTEPSMHCRRLDLGLYLTIRLTTGTQSFFLHLNDLSQRHAVFARLSDRFRAEYANAITKLT